jgi:GNAT superfamily N-acetyltransferase
MQIRKGNIADIPAAYALIKELAIYEKAEHEVNTSIESMERDGFGPNPVFEFFVATLNETVVGIALYYHSYSTWKGRCVYLDDLVVAEAHRGKGIGEALVEALKEEARKIGAKRIAWQVLNWNEPAIRFYKRLNATFDDQWINCRIIEDTLYPAK